MSKKDNHEQVDSYQISNLDQVKALAHPLRVRIIETLASSDPMTTKQVAELLGEKPTRLYHHVDLLEKAGLIHLTHTRKNRGTTEKYYEAIARQFRAASDLFSDETSNDQIDAIRPMIHTIFDNTTSELLRLIDAHQPGDSLEDEGGMLSYIEMHLPQEQLEELQGKLKEVLDLLQSFADDDSDPDEDGLRKFRLTMAHYPLDRFK
jgi:DNA-binding transcriptional ArsR family regulator